MPKGGMDRSLGVGEAPPVQKDFVIRAPDPSHGLPPGLILSDAPGERSKRKKTKKELAKRKKSKKDRKKNRKKK